MAMQSQHNDKQRHKRLPGKRPRLMIDISPELRRRIKIAAVKHDTSVREYVEQILEQALSSEDADTQEDEPRPMSRESLEQLLRIREQIRQERQGQPFDDSNEIIWQMREERSQHLGEL